MAEFRVALSGDFFKDDGSPSFSEFDLSPLRARDDVELVVLDPGTEIGPEQVAEVDALILLAPRLGLVVRLITGFTVAHSLTLALAVLGVVHTASAPVEAVCFWRFC